MSHPTLEIRLLGPLSVIAEGERRLLPRSRKIRFLLGYLAMSPGAVSRSKLCDLLWDAANDPRGELRWCLSKLRGVLGEANAARLVTSDRDLVALDLSECTVDALDIARVVEDGVGDCTDERLRRTVDLMGGELLEGLELDAGPGLAGWLSTERQRLSAMQVALARELLRRVPPASDEALKTLQRWLQASAFDGDAHRALLATLVASGRRHEAEAHLAATIRAFEQEGLEWLALREEVRSSRAAAAPSRERPAVTGPLIVDAASGVLGSRPQQVASIVASQRSRASIAVMPFVERSAQQSGHVGDGLTDDVITRLAKLRVLFVIARGTVYALGERGIGPEEAGRILGVDYVASGWVKRSGSEVLVGVELVETRASRIVWTDELGGVLGDGFHVLDGVADRIVAAIAEEIETAERNLAVLKAPTSLDAWEAYHRGLWHMYRFNGEDNRDAATFLGSALKLDPTFARAHAALSFTHFQNAFLELTRDREHQIEQAYACAHQSLGADDRDPAAHWAMGRALWLRGAQDEALSELARSVDLSPNFALGHYTLGFVHAQSGDPRAAIDATNYSRQLSPFDPLQFAMLASRALAHVRLGELDEAARWAVKATERPNAHLHILAIAVECLALAQRNDEARAYVARIRERQSGYSVENFLRAFRLEPDTERLLRRHAARVDFG